MWYLCMLHTFLNWVAAQLYALTQARVQPQLQVWARVSCLLSYRYFFFSEWAKFYYSSSSSPSSFIDCLLIYSLLLYLHLPHLHLPSFPSLPGACRRLLRPAAASVLDSPAKAHGDGAGLLSKADRARVLERRRAHHTQQRSYGNFNLRRCQRWRGSWWGQQQWWSDGKHISIRMRLLSPSVINF